jgi:hypothetical protein
MKITIADKGLEKKPEKSAAGLYFSSTTFKEFDLDVNDIEQVIGKGYTISYLYKDKEYKRESGYAKNNYLGTEFICIDIDKCEIDPDTFVEGIKYKPTIYHSTFSNLTKIKDYKYCFHLIYCFNNIILGEDNFNEVFFKLCDDYRNQVDENAKDCHRCIYTSNSSLNNYVYKNTNIIYDVSDFIIDKKDDVNSVFNRLKNDSLNISHTPSTNLSRKAENRQQDKSFILKETFFSDLNSLDRISFVNKYSSIYPYITETVVNNNMYDEGYADLRETDYYVVPSCKYKWNKVKGKGEIPKVEKGIRNKMLWQDACHFIKTTPNITKEHLVYCLIRVVLEHYDNKDKELTNQYIIRKAKEAWCGTDKVGTTKKRFKIDKSYWLQRGENDWLKVTHTVQKKMKDKDFGSLYDFNLSLEQNLKVFHQFGLSTKKDTLKAWLEEKGYDFFTDKEFRDKFIIEQYNNNQNLSYREIEIICKENSVKANKDTIGEILREYKNNCLKNDSLDISSSLSTNLSRKTNNRQEKNNVCKNDSSVYGIRNKTENWYSSIIDMLYDQSSNEKKEYKVSSCDDIYSKVTRLLNVG